MGRILKYLGIFLAVVVVLVGGMLAFIAIDGIPKYPPGHLSLKVEATPERLVRGKKFASMLCAGCHMNPTTRVLSGRPFSDLPHEFGTVYVPNITQDPVHGIGSWTDGELVYLLRTGVKRDGQYAPPWMVKLPHLSDEDLFSIVAFLRSDDPWVRAAPDQNQPSHPSFLAKFLAHVAFKALPYPKQPIEAPSKDDPVALGRYLVAGIDCYGCHSADFKTFNINEPEKTPGFMGGGNHLNDPNGHLVYTPNITMDAETGIGKWSEAQFTRALRDGFRPDNSPVLPPMDRYLELSDEEAHAIYAYLKTVPPLHNPRKHGEGYEVGPNPSVGKVAYYKYGCQSCHGTDGLGTCDLRGAHRKYKSDAEIVNWIRDPSKLSPGTKMPTWEGVIAEGDYAPLVTYVRLLGVGEGATAQRP
jgi:mono/diheme cytochrome c family protein